MIQNQENILQEIDGNQEENEKRFLNITFIYMFCQIFYKTIKSEKNSFLLRAIQVNYFYLFIFAWDGKMDDFKIVIE